MKGDNTYEMRLRWPVLISAVTVIPGSSANGPCSVFTEVSASEIRAT